MRLRVNICIIYKAWLSYKLVQIWFIPFVKGDYFELPFIVKSLKEGDWTCFCFLKTIHLLSKSGESQVYHLLKVFVDPLLCIITWPKVWKKGWSITWRSFFSGFMDDIFSLSPLKWNYTVHLYMSQLTNTAWDRIIIYNTVYACKAHSA